MGQHHIAALADEFFGDCQAGESLTCAAGHDEHAAIGFTVSVAHTIQRLDLTRPQLLRFGDLHLFTLEPGRPVDRAGFKPVETDRCDFQVVEQRLSIGAPRATGDRGDDSAREVLLLGRRQETVDVLPLVTTAFCEELALDRAEGVLVPNFGHSVDADIAGEQVVLPSPIENSRASPYFCAMPGSTLMKATASRSK